MQQQTEFLKTHWQHRYCAGGSLRKKRAGRKARPLSTKNSAHVIFKATQAVLRLPANFRQVTKMVEKYSAKFFVKIESYSVQGDHIHLSMIASKRRSYQNFFRVVAGQIAQKLKVKWVARPYTRVVKGRRAWEIVQNYIQLNEKEARNEIPYRSERLRGLRLEEWERLWV